MSEFEFLSLLVAILAAIISFVSLYRTHHTAEQQVALQKVQADLANLQHRVLLNEQTEKQNADLRVTFAEEERRQLLVFENRGPATAYEVDFELFIEGGEDSPLIESEVSVLFPIKALRPDERMSMLVAVSLAMKFPLAGKLSWKNGLGQPQEQECRIPL